jgi:hypothetical protein
VDGAVLEHRLEPRQQILREARRQLEQYADRADA